MGSPCYVKALRSQKDTTVLTITYCYHFYCKLLKKKLQSETEFCTTGILGNRLQIKMGFQTSYRLVPNTLIQSQTFQYQDSVSYWTQQGPGNIYMRTNNALLILQSKVVTISTTRINASNFSISPHRVFLGFVWLSVIIMYGSVVNSLSTK
jgi:hypothetical protein